MIDVIINFSLHIVGLQSIIYFQTKYMYVWETQRQMLKNHIKLRKFFFLLTSTEIKMEFPGVKT